MSVTREIKVYRGLYNTGEKINFSPITETVTGDILETWYSIEVSGGIPARDMGVETTDGFVYPMFAIHGGRTYYYDEDTQESITLKGVLLNHEIDNSWIVVYAPKGNYGIGVPRPEIAYTENKDVRIHVGSSVDTIENDVLEQSEDFDFFEISISNGIMSDNFFTYGGTFSPTCTIEMMPTDKIAQGNFIRLEFKLYGIWQNFGVFYVKEPPESTSEYVSVSGIGMLEMCGDFIAKDATKSSVIWDSAILSIKGLVHNIYDSFGVPVLFNFDVNRTETQRNYYQNSSIVIPHGIEENEMESNGITYSSYIMTGGFTSIRNAISKLAVALYSNAVEIAGAIVIMHNDEHDFADCGCFEDYTIEEPVQRMNAYYCPYKVNVECQQMQMAEFSNKATDSTGTTVKYDVINAPALMDTTKTVNILNEKVIDEARKIIYYPVTIAEDDGGWCDVTHLSPIYWGQMDFAKYPIHDFATLMALNKPFYYYPIETELNGYSPFVYAGAGIKMRINGTVYFVYVGTLDLSWEGGMFSMSISSPADIDLNGGNDSTTSSGASSSAGIGTLSVGVLNSIKKAKLLDAKSILGEKIADSTIENANIADATIGYEKVNKSFITDLTADNAYIENLTAKVAELGYLKADSADLKYATITNLEAVDGKIDTLESKAITTDNLEAKVATLGYLSVESANAKFATIENLTAVDGKIDTLSSKAITTENLTAKVAELGYLSVKSAEIGYAKVDFSNVGTQVVSSSMIIDGAVTNEKVANLSANKITSGTIDASKITVTNLNADNITVGTINGHRIGNGSLSLDKLAEEVPTKEYLDNVEKNLQGQIDGAIETFTKTEIPTLNNEPANAWTDNATRKKHIGDICYVVNPSSSADGYCYRFTNVGTEDNPSYTWSLIKDSDVTKALQDIIDINGEITGIKRFDSEISAWKVDTDSELSSLKTRTTNLETDIGSKVSSSVFNELKQTVDKNSASITSLSSTVSKKADGSTVETLTNTVNEVKQTADSNSLSISSMQTEIGKKADGSTVTEVSNKVTQITADLNGFKSTVSTTYATKTDFNNLQIGGRNLIKDTSTAKVNTNWKQNGWGGNFTTYDVGVYSLLAQSGWQVARYVNLKEYSGKTVTISFYGMCLSNETTSTEQWGLFISNEVGTNPWVSHYLSDKPEKDTWNFYEYTCVLNKDGQIGIGAFCAPEGKNLQTTWLIKKLKLELGNKATDWSPAPEDIEQTAKSYTDQKADEITQVVSKKVGADEIISKINQTAETITIDASKLDLNGYVTVKNLKGDGTTEINGANIITGSIKANKIDIADLFAQNITATSMNVTGDSKFGPFGVSSDTAQIIARDTDNNQVTIGTEYLKLFSGVSGTETLRIMDIESELIHMGSGSGLGANYGLSGFKINDDNEGRWLKGETNKIEFRDVRSTAKYTTYGLDEIQFMGVSNFTIGTDLKIYGNLTVNATTFIEEDGISFVNSYGKQVKNIHMISASNNFDLGHGGYDNKIGATNIYGNEIWIKPYKNLQSTRQLRILWSGGHYMGTDQTATLSDKIENQLNGIVLVWSKYSNGVQNYEWNSFFIPKQIVAERPGEGHVMYCIGSWPSYKYVYINQTTIAGSSANTSTSNKINGVNVDSKNHVLRYVFGV